MSLPALPCPVLQGPQVGACPGELAFRSPAQQSPGKAPEGLVAPSVSVLGSDSTGLPGMSLADFLLLLSVHPTWPAYLAKALLFPPLPWFPWQNQAAHGTEGPRDALRSEGQEAIWAVGDPSYHHPRTLSWNGKFTRTPFLGGFLSLWGPLERGIVLIYKYI